MRYFVILVVCLAAVSGCYFPGPPAEAEAELALTVQMPRSLESLLSEQPTVEYFTRISLWDAAGEIVPIHGREYYEEKLKQFTKKKKGVIQLKDVFAGEYVLEMAVGEKDRKNGKWVARYHGRSAEFRVEAGKPAVVEIELEEAKKTPHQITPIQSKHG